MAEYDAFGRKKGENPLEQRPAAAEPVAVTTPAAVPPPATRSRTFAVIVAAALVVALASVGVAAALLTATDGEEGVTGTVAAEDVQPAPREVPATPAERAQPPAPAPAAPAGLAAGSLITRPALGRALEALREADLGRPVSVRVAAARVDAQLVTADGRLRSVQVSPQGGPRELSSVQVGGVASMPWSAVDAGAPERLLRAAAERERRSADDVDYLVLLDLGEPTWGLFFKGGAHYQGDAAGRLLRRTGA